MGILDNIGAEGVKYAYTKRGGAKPFRHRECVCDGETSLYYLRSREMTAEG